MISWNSLVIRDEKWANTYWPGVGCRAKFAQFLALATKAFILYPKETYWWDLMFLSKGKSCGFLSRFWEFKGQLPRYGAKCIWLVFSHTYYTLSFHQLKSWATMQKSIKLKRGPKNSMLQWGVMDHTGWSIEFFVTMNWCM